MPARRLRTVLHAARRSAAPDPTTLPDAHLLGRFLDHRDEAAFAALVRRHGPVVSAACRLAGLNPSDHDDVFQAAFLALVRQANSIRDGKSVGGWLFRIATRVAIKLRNRAGTVELPADMPERTPAAPDADTHRVLDEEVAKLPEKYRLAVALVYLAGRNTTQAAAELGWAKGTVLTRLAWARERLRSQLVRRGVTLAAGAATVVTVSPGVAAGVVRVCSQFLAGGVPAGASGVAVELSKGVVQDMALTKLKWAAGVLLVAAALTGVGLGRWGSGEANAQPDAKKPEARKKDKKPKPPSDEPPRVQPTPEPERQVTRPLSQLPVGMPVASELSPAESKAKAAGFTVTKPVGVWVREVVIDESTTRLTLKFDEDRLKGTAEMTAGKQKVSAVLEADYAINGESTVFGVISGIDVGELPDGIDDEISTLVSQPFAFRYRISDGHLTVKEFKGLGIGVASQTDDAIKKSVSLLCGRYAAVDPAKPNTGTVPKTTLKPRGGNNYPTPSYLEHAPRYFPQPISPEGQPPMPNSPSNNTPPPAIVPTLPPPVQRQSSNSYSEEPTTRMNRLLNQSEDHGPPGQRPADDLREKWRRFWFNDRPSHLTPEQIHGGIMKADPPTDSEVMAALRPKPGQPVADEADDDITIVKNLIAHKIDPPRAFPVVGQAQLHHAQWECMVYSRDAETQKPKARAVYLDKDKLHAHVGGK